MHTIYYLLNESKIKISTEEDPETVKNKQFESLQKYIIFNKIREIKDKIEYSNLVISKEFKEIMYFLNILINFFEIFEYDQIINIIDDIVIQINNLKKDSDIIIKRENNEK